MAFGAIHLLVFAFQREIGLGVVEFRETGGRGERLLVVAFLAVCAEFGLVRVVVATVAIFERHTCKPLKFLPVFRLHLVAFLAIERLVFSNQREVRFVVVKLGRRLPGVGQVAFGAVIRQRFLVIILVAIEALATQAEVSFLAFFQLRIVHVIRLVAFPAINFFMRPGQFVAGELVVEGLFIEAHHVEVAPVVVRVAGGAVFRPHVFRVVVALLRIEAGFDFLVAGEAFFVGNLLAERVALGAVGHAFEVGVGFGEVAGGKLGG